MPRPISDQRINFLFLNAGHFLDHFFMLVFATASALVLARTWGLTYGELIPYATPGFIAFAVFSIPAGWLADKWSRQGMMAIFFIGIGLSAIATALAQSPLQIAFGLFAIGVFAAIYHPVGLSMVVHGRQNTGVPLAVNGVFGNLGVASAALITGFLIDTTGWRAAFIAPGLISVIIGAAYIAFISLANDAATAANRAASTPAVERTGIGRRTLTRLFAIILFSAAVGGLIFQSTTFALPKIFDERLSDFAGTATLVGWYTFVVFAIASFAQLVVGFLVDRHAVRTVFAFVAGLQAVLFAVMYQLTGVPALMVSVAFMLVVFGQIPINDVLIARATTTEYRSRVYALRSVVSFSVLGNDGSADRLDPRQLGICQPVFGASRRRDRNLVRGLAAAADSSPQRHIGAERGVSLGGRGKSLSTVGARGALSPLRGNASLCAANTGKE